MTKPDNQAAHRRTSHHLPKWCLGLMCLLLSIGLARAQDAVTTLNSAAAEPGYVNGALSSAKFNDPAGLAFDAAGNLYVADSRNHVIRKVASDGTVTLLAGKPGEPGFANGAGTTAQFDTPFGVAVAANGNVIVADTGNHVLRSISPRGDVSTFAGQPGTPGATNGPVSVAAFRTPLGLAFASNGNLYVADSGNHLIRCVTTNNVVETVAGLESTWGYQDGTTNVALFNGPVDVAVAADGRIFVSDGFNHVIRCVETNGTVSTIAGKAGTAAWADGPASEARFWNPAGLALDVSGDLYVADSLNHAIRKITPDGMVITVSGRGRTYGLVDGVNGTGRYFNPYDLAFDAQGHMIVSDSYNQALRQVLVPFSVSVDSTSGNSTIQWEAVIGKQYQVQFCDNLKTANWQNLGTVQEATTRSLSVSDNLAAPATRFYRVLIVP